MIINNTHINNNEPLYFIAELSAYLNQDINTLLKIVEEAA
jgi:sialic acid synthase SpsE